jgi:hypothetical protein
MTTTVNTLLRRLAGPVQSLPEAGATDLVLRFAGPADTAAIDRLAALDSQRAPRGAVLLAEVDDTAWAALSVDDGHAVADPFRPTGELVALLLERARQIKRARHHGPVERVWPKAGYDHPAWS